jgi:hypothetical protein
VDVFVADAGGYRFRLLCRHLVSDCGLASASVVCLLSAIM